MVSLNRFKKMANKHIKRGSTSVMTLKNKANKEEKIKHS